MLAREENVTLPGGGYERVPCPSPGRFSLREESVLLTVSSALVYLTAWRTGIS